MSPKDLPSFICIAINVGSMRDFGYQIDQKITDVMRENSFTVSAEIIPPRNGAEQSQLLEGIEGLVSSGSQFLAVTKGAGGSLRGGSLPIAQTIKDHFRVPCIAHFTCRDLLPQEVENQLMDHHLFGIRNILALRGDPPSGQPHWKAREGCYNYAYELIHQIAQLNRGIYLKRDGETKESKVQEATDFCIGAAVYPEHANPRERVDFLKRKIDVGAEFAITQMVFDPDVYGDFLEESGSFQIPVLPGTRLLTSREQALRMGQRFSVKIPDWMLKALPEKHSPEEQNRVMDLFLTYVEKLRQRGAPGIHLFVLSGMNLARSFIQTLKSNME